jgi:hypothetical protein
VGTPTVLLVFGVLWKLVVLSVAHALCRNRPPELVIYYLARLLDFDAAALAALPQMSTASSEAYSLACWHRSLYQPSTDPVFAGENQG